MITYNWVIVWLLLFFSFDQSLGSYNFLYNGFKITLHNDTLKTWDEARNACRSTDGGNLVNILSQDLQTKITNLLKAWDKNLVVTKNTKGNKWLAGYNINAKEISSQCKFKWGNGKSVTLRASNVSYQNWYRTEPNCGKKNPYCVAISPVAYIDNTHGNIIGKWVDDRCCRKKYYICEVPCGYNPCINGGTCNVTNGQPTCTCLRGFTGDTCETFASSSLPNFSNQFTLTCKITETPLPAVQWKITSLQPGATVQDITYLSSFAVQTTTFIGDDIIESNLTISAAGLCLGPSNISCWANYTESERLLHTFNLNQKAYDVIGKNYCVFSESSLNVNNRTMDCNALKGELVSIPNEHIQKSLEEILETKNWKNRVWIGLHKLTNGMWEWPNRVQPLYTNWEKNQPNTETGKRCAFISSASQWKWKFSSCDVSIGYHICEVRDNTFPTIVNLQVPYCVKDNKSTITVIWRPSITTTHLLHEIKVSNAFGVIKMELIPQKQVDDQIISNIFANLEPRTQYNVTISLAPEICKKRIAVTRLVTTGYVIPKPVKTAVANLSKNNTCMITWTWKADDKSNVKNFAVNITKYPNIATSENFDVISTALQTEGFIMNVSIDVRSTSFQVFPNRRHEIMIYPQSYACDGPFIVASRECVAPRTGPPSLPSPALSGQTGVGEITLTILRPDETNGPISCIFVIGQYHNSRVSVKPNSSLSFLDNLNNQNISQVKTGQEYLVFACSSFQKSKKSLTLGTGKKTSCNIYQVDDVQASQNRPNASNETTYTGSNLKLVSNKYYSFYIISVTPVNEGHLDLVSSPVVVLQTVQYTGFTLFWIVGVICCFALLLLLVFLCIRRKRLVSKLETTLPLTDITTSMPLDHNQPPDQNKNAVIYENFELSKDTYENIFLSTQNLKETYLNLINPSHTKLKEEFSAIQTASAAINAPSTIANLQENLKMNRYRNIVPFDNTRVILQTDQANPDSDYINASYINSFNMSKHFIATQDPLERTIAYFWTMIWQQKIRVIVMLTKLMESGKKKCIKYWPDSGKILEVGAFRVTGKDSISKGNYIVRRFHLMLTTEPQSEHLVITHYQYTDWPDHGVPVTTTSVIRMYKDIENTSSGETSPIVVHCSAGAGRTGTVIGIDYLLQEVKSRHIADVYSAVMKLRRQRCQMVQTQKQYTFIYKVITEIQVLGDTEFNRNEITSKIIELESNSYQEFHKLDDIPPLQTAREVHNTSLNQHEIQDNFPYDHSRVMVYNVDNERSSSINASYIETYASSRRTIVAQGPTLNTVNNFWKCILEKQVNIIIALLPLDAENDHRCCCYWPNKEQAFLIFGDITVTLSKTTSDLRSIKRELEVTDGRVTARVMQIHFYNWRSEEIVTDFDEVITTVRDVDRLCNQTTRNLLLIHCSDGQRRSGVFCAMMNLIDRLNAEQRIDVFRTVKDLRDMWPGMIPTMNLYKACYQILKHYLSEEACYDVVSY